MQAATTSPRARLRRIARAAAVGLAALLLLSIAGATVLAYKAEALVRARAVEAAERAGARIGREVTVGPAKIALGSDLTIEIDDVRVAAAPGQAGVAAEPLLEIGAVRVHVARWSLLRSRGKEVEVTAIEMRKPVVRLVRLADGTLSYADVAAKLEAGPPPEERARKARVGRLAITDGTVELVDLSRDTDRGGVHLAVEKIDASAPVARPDLPLDLTVDAAVLAPAQNLHLELGLAPRDEPSTGTLGRVRRAAVRLAKVDLDPILPFVPRRSGLGVAGATLAIDARIAVDPKGPVDVDGSIEATDLRLSRDAGDHDEPLGPKVDAAVRADVTVDPEALALTARSLRVTAGGMTIEGHADLRGPVDAPTVKALALDARDVTFERLIALAPPSLIPRGVALSGPIGLYAEARGAPSAAEIAVALDLRDASVTLPDLHKPAGTPLSAELRGRTGDGGLAIDALGVTVGPIAFALRGRVRSATDVDLAFDSGEVPLDAVLRLFPAVARAVPAAGTLAGAVQAAGHVKRSGQETRADARVALRRADVKTPALTLAGAADLSASARAAPGDLTVTADLDAGALRAVIPGRVDKAAGAPFSLHAVVERAGAVTTVREARVAIDGASISGAGRHDAAAHALAIERVSCELDLAALARALPALVRVPEALVGARLRAAVTLEGDPDDLGAAHLRLDGLDLATAFGHVRGMLDLDHAAAPKRVSFDLDGDTIDLDEIGGGEGARPGVAFPPDLEAHGSLRVAHLRSHVFRGEASDVVADLALDHGSLSLPKLHMTVFGGSVQADGSRLDLGRGAPAFSLRARVDEVDLGLLSEGRETTGKLDAEVALDGAGSDWASVAPTLAGTTKLTLTDAHVHTQHTVRSTVINPLLGAVAEHFKKKHPVRTVDMRIDRATVAIRAADGRATTTAPLVAVTEDGTVTVEGAVGFDRRLALNGSVAIPPAVIEKHSSGKLVPFGPVTVKVRVDGTTDAPRVELIDLGSTVRSLLGAGVHGLARKVERAFGE